MQKKLPIGIENFEDMIKENYYYVDKTITKWTWFSQSIHKNKKIRKILKYEYVKIFLWNFRTNKEMVWRLPLRKYRYLLPMGCDQSLPSIKNRTRCNTTAILDQYKRKLYRKTIYRKSKPTNKKRNRAIDRRKSNPERNQIRTNIQRTRQHDRKSLECTFRNRLPYQTGKTTRKDENRLKDFCKACKKALKQIKEKHYDQKLEEEGYETILNYGIACYKKRCKVMVDKW